mgnify:CR=1 FL=1
MGGKRACTNAGNSYKASGRGYCKWQWNPQKSAAWRNVSGINFKYMHDPYVRDIVWMTDDDNDGTWEIYAFNEDGYLDTSISKSGWTWDFGRYGIHDTYGYLTTNYYKGAWSNMGPYQVVRRGNTWYCENGTLPDFSDACWRFTGDYSRDAFAIIGGLDHELSRMSSGSYRNVEVKEVK